MRYLMVVLVLAACGGPRSPTAEAPPSPPPAAPVPDPSLACADTPLHSAPAWAGWREGGTDPCLRLTACAEAGCAEATCLHRHYGCLDSGTIARELERDLGADYYVTVACCPE